MVQRSAATYIKAMNRQPTPDFALAAEHLNGESVRDIRIILKNLSAQHRTELHKAALVWPGVCSNVARLTEVDYLKVEPGGAKAADACGPKPAPVPAVVEPPKAPPITAEPQPWPGGIEPSDMRCFIHQVREEVRHSMEGEIYEMRLKEGVELLKSSGFGRAEGHPTGIAYGQIQGWNEEAYNKKFWEVEPHDNFGGRLVLKASQQPAAAIDDMFGHLGDWNVECGQFVQVSNLYALRHALGTAGFNRVRTGVAFAIQLHGSTAVERDRYYERFGPGEPMLLYPSKQPTSKSNDELLREVPIGSRVMWTNLQAPPGSAFRNENSVKLGEDLYAAHGFTAKYGKNTFSRKELERALADITKPDPDEAYIQANVFIAEIEHYRRPQNQ